MRQTILWTGMVGWSVMLSTVALVAAGIAAERLDEEPGELRRPVALVLSGDGQRLFLANRDTGTISVVDCQARQVTAEQPIGKRLSHLTGTADPGVLLATDETSHELLVVDVAGELPQVVDRIAVAPYPVNVLFDPTRQRAYVSSLWSRQVTVVQLATAPDAEAAANRHVLAKLDMPFAPRQQVLAPDSRTLIVADAFAGRLVTLDTETLEIQREHAFPAHNIRGLGVSADGNMLVVSHQMLNELANTIRNDVHWGLLMSNDLRWFKLDSVLSESGSLFDGAHMHPLGEAGRATADPQNLYVANDGMVVITLGGVGEIAFGYERDFSLQRLKVGRRPVDVVVDSDQRLAYVANMFDDSISLVDLAERKVVGTISLGAQRPVTQVERGELLFYDGRLSHDGWMTCNSCHADGHTNGLQNDNLSDDSFGAPKRVLTLLGVKDTAPYAWNGGVERLETQIRNSIEKTMQSKDTARREDIQAIAAFLRTLEPPPSVDALRGTLDESAVARGSQLFSSLQCTTCHAPPLYTTPETYDVGLTDREGNRLYNPPSLRGVSQRGPYLHDDQTEKYNEPPKAAQLEDVLVKFRHQLDRELSDQERKDLLAFLRSL